jgi:hypothetical protein
MRNRPWRIARLFGALGEALTMMFGSAPAPAPRDEPPDQTLASLEELERLRVARLNQAEQIFQFEVLNAESRSSLEALRFFDLMLTALLALQLVAALLLLGRPDPNAVGVFALLGVGVVVVCWGLGVTSWPETSPVDSAFLSDLAVDPASARAAAAIKAAGLAKRNENRRTLKSQLFAVALLLTVADLGWVSATHVQQLATSPASASASPSPTPSPSPTATPTARPTATPSRPTPRPQNKHVQQRGPKRSNSR